MDFISNMSKKDDEPKPSNPKPADPGNHLKPTKSDLIHSAKVVADVAQAHLRHEPEKYDKAEVAGATADLLNAAAEYGKLDDKGIGKYVDKAEGYLRHYQGSHSDGKTGGDHKAATGDGGDDKKHGGEGGGPGGFLKNMAGDFLKK